MNLSRIHSSQKGQGDLAFGAFVVAVIAVVILGIGFIFTATYESVPPDKIALHYTGGPIDGTHFVGVVQPGTGAKFYGLSENLYKIPATQRTYIISKDATEGDKAGADFITAPSKDRVSFTFEAAAYFVVNTDTDVIRKFFEEVCLHDKCYTGGGWDKMLAQYFRKPLELAIAQEAKKYDQADLYSNPDTIAAMNRSISKSLADDINESIGFPAFCGPDSTEGHCTDFKVIIKNPTPPQAVIDAYNATSAARQGVKTAQQEAEKAKAAAIGTADAAREAAAGARDAQNTRASAKSLTPEQLAYIQASAMATCAANNNCTLIFNGSSGGVNINTGK